MKQLPSKFKTLVYKNPIDPMMPFAHVTFLDNAVMSGSVPQMFQAQNTIESMGNFFPASIDFSEVKLVELTINYELD